MSDGSEPPIGIAIFQSLHPSISVSDVSSSLSFILPQFGGSRAKTKEMERTPSSLPPPSAALQTNLRFSRRHLRRRPSVAGGRRARAWPHLPHSSSPEDTAEFEVTATNLGEKGKMARCYGYSCVGVKGFRSASESRVILIYIDRQAHGAFIQPHTLLSSFTFGNMGH